MVEINPSVGAAYGGGQQIDLRVQALEGLKALERSEQTSGSEAAIQARVARRTESVIVTISSEARARVASDAQSVAQGAANAANDVAPVAQALDAATLIAPQVTEAPAVAEAPEMAEPEAAALSAAEQQPITDARPEAANAEPAARPERVEPTTSAAAAPPEAETDEVAQADSASADSADAAEAPQGDASEVEPV